MSSGSFGLETLFRVAEKDVNKKEDVLVVLVHWFLTKYGFRCIGLGEDKTFTGQENGSELLPDGWSGSDMYTIRYVYDQKLYILRGVLVDHTLIINLLKTPDLSVSNLALNVEDVVPSLKGSVDEMIPSHTSIAERIHKELVEPISKRPPTPEARGIAASSSRPRAENPSAPPTYPSFEPPSPFDYGRQDLDPLGLERGGGMLFDPFRGGLPQAYPRGRIPGARFDPIRPPGIGRPDRFNPNPDHLPPPGFGDDMFM